MARKNPADRCNTQCRSSLNTSRLGQFTPNRHPETRMDRGVRAATRHRSNGEKRSLGRRKRRKTPASAASGTQQCRPNPRQYWRLGQIKKKPAQGWLSQIGGVEFTTRLFAIGASEYCFGGQQTTAAYPAIWSATSYPSLVTLNISRLLPSGVMSPWVSNS